MSHEHNHTHDHKHYENIKVTPLPQSEVEIEGEITVEALDHAEIAALEKFSLIAKVPGFRAGHVPKDVLKKQIGEVALLAEAGEIALNTEYGNILDEFKIRAIGNPHITITKIAPKNPLGFKIKTAIMPEITLPKYKKIAEETLESKKKEEVLTVTDKEIDEVIEQARKSKQEEGKELPEFSPEFVKTLGDFKDVADFREKIKVDMLAHKEREAREKKRTVLLEKLVAETALDVPELIVSSELDKMVAQFKDDITRAGLKYEDYLKQINKTEADVRGEWKENAVKKSKAQLILGKIAVEEKLAPTEEEIKKEVDHIVAHYADADRFRVRMYVENFLTNEKVLKFLEELK